MLSKARIILLLPILVEMGCARIAQEFDTTLINNKTVYRKSHTLPPLNIPPELAKNRNDNETR